MSSAAHAHNLPPEPARTAARSRANAQPHGPGGGSFGAGREEGTLTADQQKILDYAKAHSAGAQVVLAEESGSQAAESHIIVTDETVIDMGGFSGAAVRCSQ